jgi:hypothetical protein
MTATKNQPERRPISRHDLATTPRAWLAFFELQQGIRQGETDVIFAGEEQAYQRASHCAATLLTLQLEGVRQFSSVIVLAPNWRREDDVGIRDRVEACLRGLDARNTALGHRFDVRTVSDARPETLLAILESLTPCSAVYLPYAQDFEHGGAASEELDTEARSVARLVGILRRVLPVAQVRQLYVLLDAGCEPPLRERAMEELHLEHVCVCAFGVFNERRAIADSERRWVRFVNGGAEQLARSELLERGITGVNADLVVGSAYAATKQYAKAWALIAPHATTLASLLAPALLVELARWALKADARPEASELLALLVDSHPAMEVRMFQRALSLALRLQHAALAGRVERAARSMHPDFDADYVRFRQALDAGDYAAAADLATEGLGRGNVPAEMAYERAVATYLARGDVAGFLQAARAGAAPDEARAILEATLFHVRIGDFRAALQLDLPSDANDVRRGHAWDLRMSAIEKMMKYAGETLGGADRELLVRRILEAAAFLAHEPADERRVGRRRLRLAQALSPEGCGLFGITVLATQIGREAGASLAAASNFDVAPVAPDAVLDLIAALGEDRGSDLVVGEGALPASYENRPLPELRGLQNRVAEQARFLASGVAKEDVDLNIASVLAYLSSVLARATESPTHDIRTVRTIAVAVLEAGHAQSARNIAEQCLQMAEGGVGRRVRVAWLAFADIYLRNHLIVESGLALAVALSVRDAALEPDELFDEYYLRARFLRDVGVPSDVPSLLAEGRELLAGHGKLYAHRFELLELQIELHATSRPTDEALLRILRRATEVCDAAKGAADDLRPSAQLLGQALMEAGSRGLSVSDATLAYRAILAELPPASQAYLCLLIDGRPTLEDIQGQVARLNNALYAEDVGADARTVRLLSSRLLAEAARAARAGDAAFLADLSSDHAVSLLSERGGLQPPSGRFISSPAKAMAVLADLARVFDVHIVSVSGGRLVRVTSTLVGLDAVVEEESVFSLDYFAAWRKRFPQAFGEQESSEAGAAASAHHVMKPLGLSLKAPVRPMVLVPSIELSGMTWQLATVAGTFTGVHAATATAPSLAWLAAAMRTPRRTDGGRVLWIPSNDSADTDPLAHLFDEVTSSESTRHFEISDRATPPPLLRGASIAVLGVHGALDRGRQRFRHVSDEVGNRWSMRELARQLAEAEIVVLVSCHAGRTDLDALMSTPIGFARLILDYGARAVVAASWALSVRAATLWLPPFLEKIGHGEVVGNATFYANTVVAATLDHPGECLAMHVYGDPTASVRA